MRQCIIFVVMRPLILSVVTHNHMVICHCVDGSLVGIFLEVINPPIVPVPVLP